MSDEKTKKIRELNDAFRQSFVGGRVMCTVGVSNLADATREAIYNAVRAFDGFSCENDPYCEHDFGSIELDGQKFFFKIDYHDPAMEYGSEDPSDPAQTARVMTIMLAEEY